ncbi:MAG TPA: hypothetical protein VHZ78_14915 [Rhizomicrobium sp.]|jgi:hypothetical protein|nr:hypothetical protein [Rhizomicrobium sp.]
MTTETVEQLCVAAEQVPAPRPLWTAPTLRRLALSNAELSVGINPDAEGHS